MGYVYKGTQRDLGPVTAPAILATEPPTAQPAPAPHDPSKCGTNAGYTRHLRAGTPKCRPCKDANAAYCRDYEARKKLGLVRRGFYPDKCGTMAGYKRHLRHAVPPCGPCLAANTDYVTAYLAARKTAA